MAEVGYKIVVGGLGEANKAFASLEAQIKEQLVNMRKLKESSSFTARMQLRVDTAKAISDIKVAQAAAINAERDVAKEKSRLAKLKAKEDQAAVKLLNTQDKNALKEKRALEVAAEKERKQAAKVEEKERLAAIRKQALEQRQIDRDRLKEERRISREIAKEAKQRAAEEKRWSRGNGRLLGTVSSQVGSRVSRVAQMGIGALTATAVYQAREAMKDQRKALAIEKGSTDGVTQKQALNAANTVAKTTGIEASSVLTGMQGYIAKTGRGQDAVALAGLAGKLAVTSDLEDPDAAIGDMYGMLAELSEKMNVTDPKQLESLMANFIEQGKKGSFEFKQLAKFAPEMFSSMSAVGLKGEGHAKELIALAQVTKRGTTDAEASTDIKNFFNALAGRAKEIHQGKYASSGQRGFDVYVGNDHKKGMRSTRDIVSDLMGSTQGDMGLIKKMLGEQGMNAVKPFANMWIETFNSTQGNKKTKTAAANDAVKAEFDRLTEGGSVDALNATFKDIADRDPSIALNASFAELRQAVGDQLVPEIVKLVPHIKEAVPLFGELVKKLVALMKWAEENPGKAKALAGGAGAAWLLGGSGMMAGGKLLWNLMKGPGAKAAAGAAGSALGASTAGSGLGAAAATTGARVGAKGLLRAVPYVGWAMLAYETISWVVEDIKKTNDQIERLKDPLKEIQFMRNRNSDTPLPSSHPDAGKMSDALNLPIGKGPLPMMLEDQSVEYMTLDLWGKRPEAATKPAAKQDYNEELSAVQAEEIRLRKENVAIQQEINESLREQARQQRNRTVLN